MLHEQLASCSFRPEAQKLPLPSRITELSIFFCMETDEAADQGFEAQEVLSHDEILVEEGTVVPKPTAASAAPSIAVNKNVIPRPDQAREWATIFVRDTSGIVADVPLSARALPRAGDKRKRSTSDTSTTANKIVRGSEPSRVSVQERMKEFPNEPFLDNGGALSFPRFYSPLFEF
jgi:hypothetical protein